MAAVWSTHRLRELIVEGVEPVDDADTEEKRSFKSLFTLAVGVYIQVGKSEIRQSNTDEAILKRLDRMMEVMEGMKMKKEKQDEKITKPAETIQNLWKGKGIERHEPRIGSDGAAVHRPGRSPK
ncbi:hypothetical protein K3495_g11331 [Podosphaera aphanis]|nr:hypothetical protein K3495_g11331 [Podosphaera aphanis]